MQRLTTSPAISIVIPIYNEAGNITPLYDRIVAVLTEYGRSFEIILVNDGSRDQSEAELTALAARDTRVKVVNFRRNYGQTAALMGGFNAARGEVVVPMDGDLQNDPADIPLLVNKLEEGYAMVSGWRKDRKDNLFMRTFPSNIANWLISRSSGVDLHDHGCTLKAYRHDVIHNIRLYGEMHRFIAIYVKWYGGTITEIPVRHHPRINGQSKYGISRIVKVILDLMVVKFLEDYDTKPIYVFGLMGIMSLAVSIIAFMTALYERVFNGISLIQTPLPLFTAISLLIGFVCVLLGLLAEIMVRTYYESQNKRTYLIRNTINIDPES